MQDQAVQWDVRSMLCESSTVDQVLVFFLLAVLLVIGIKLLRVWKMVKPFSNRLPEEIVDYVRLLTDTARSLTIWIQFTLLFGGLCLWMVIAKIAQNLILEPRPVSIGWCDYQQISGGVELVLVVTLIEFLVKWYLEKRLQRLSNRSTG